MKEEVAKEWTAALRLGGYEQGTGALRSQDDKYCCLGVLCELAVAKGIIPAPIISEFSDVYAYPGGFFAFLPREVQLWAGMRSATGGYPGNVKLTALNDNGHSFAEIADIIDRTWQDL